MQESIYYDESGRAYAVRDGVSVWLEAPSAASELQFEYVGFGPRFGARVIDLVLIYLLAFVVGTGLGVFSALTGNKALLARAAEGQSPASFGISILAALVFYIVAEAIHGSTPGKMLLGMRVVCEDGSPCGLTQAIKRSVAYLADSLFFGVPAAISMGKTPRQQRFGDKWAKTVVVKARSLQPEQRRSGALFAGATAAASVAYMTLTIVSMLA